MLIPDGCTGRIDTTPSGDADFEEWDEELVHDGPCPAHPTPADTVGALRQLADFLELHPELLPTLDGVAPLTARLWGAGLPALAAPFVDGAEDGAVEVNDSGLARRFGPIEVRLYLGYQATRSDPKPEPTLLSLGEVLAKAAAA